MNEKLNRLINPRLYDKQKEEEKRLNNLLHLIFSASELQAKIALSMIIYGADVDYSLATCHHLSRGN